MGFFFNWLGVLRVFCLFLEVLCDLDGSFFGVLAFCLVLDLGGFVVFWSLLVLYV